MQNRKEQIVVSRWMVILGTQTGASVPPEPVLMR